jgi:hypothetical protein
MKTAHIGNVTISIDDAAPSAGPARPRADFGSCLMPALLAALPPFLSALVDCMQGNSNGGSGSYDPGDRRRC